MRRASGSARVENRLSFRVKAPRREPPEALLHWSWFHALLYVLQQPCTDLAPSRCPRHRGGGEPIAEPNGCSASRLRWTRARARLEDGGQPADGSAALRPRQCRHRPGGRNASRSTWPITPRSSRFVGRTASISLSLGQEGPLCAGIVDDLEASRHQGLRTEPRRGAA